MALATVARSKSAAPKQIRRRKPAPKPERVRSWIGTGLAPQNSSTAPIGVQAKLTVNETGDQFEREADRVADEVLRTPASGLAGAADAGPRQRTGVQRAIAHDAPRISTLRGPAATRFPLPRAADTVQRACSGCQEEELQRMCSGCQEEELQRACSGCQEEELQRQADEEEEETLQAKQPSGAGVPVVTPGLHAGIDTLRRGGGQSLPGTVRGFMEPRFQRDLSGVRVHTSDRAVSLSSRLQARAFTVGNDVFFNRGEFRPAVDSGRRLLAHELTHTIQQTGGSAPAAQLQRKKKKKSRDMPPCEDEDAGAPLQCVDTSNRHGKGKVEHFSDTWLLSNFDVDEHLLKEAHLGGLSKERPNPDDPSQNLPSIADQLRAILDTPEGARERVKVIGSASAPGTHCHNLALSKRRARCAQLALIALGIPGSRIEVTAIGDVFDEFILGVLGGKKRKGKKRENPGARSVAITIRNVKKPKPKPQCPKLDPQVALKVWMGCRSREEISMVIGVPDASPPIYRKFVWQKLFSVPKDCEFFPQLDPAKPQTLKFPRALRLAWAEDAGAPSDFWRFAVQKGKISEDVTVMDGPPIVLSTLRFYNRDGEEAKVPFPGQWQDGQCLLRLVFSKPLDNYGLLKPDGPVECGSIPRPEHRKCHKFEKCPKPRQESTAKKFRARLKPISGWRGWLVEKGTGLFDFSSGTKVYKLDVETVKTEEEKKQNGGDVWRPYMFAVKQVHGPEGCHSRPDPESARGEADTGESRSLSGLNYGAAYLGRDKDSNAGDLEIISGLDRWSFDLLGDSCVPGGGQYLVGAISEWGDVRCGSLDLSIPEKKECHDDCPEGVRTCPHGEFLLRFGRIALENLPLAIHDKVVQHYGCNAEAAMVNIGAASFDPVWRSFLWVQSTESCPFSIRKDSVPAVGGKATFSVKPKLKIGIPPKIGISPEFDSSGLRLATESPDMPNAPSDFVLGTEVGKVWTGGRNDSNLFSLSPSVSRSQVVTPWAPVDWLGFCKSSDKGQLVPWPGGKVECGTPPAPAKHDLPAHAKCPQGFGILANNLKFLYLNMGLIARLGSQTGIVTSHLERFDKLAKIRGLPFTASGVRFYGQVPASKGKLQPVVVILDMLVTKVRTDRGRVWVTFRLLSEPCAYRLDGSPTSLRLSRTDCGPSLRLGEVTTISSLFPTLDEAKEQSEV